MAVGRSPASRHHVPPPSSVRLPRPFAEGFSTSVTAAIMRVCRGPTPGRSLKTPLPPRLRGHRSVMSPTGYRRTRDSADPPVTSTSPLRPCARRAGAGCMMLEECFLTNPITPSVCLDGKAESARQWTSTHARLRTTLVCRFSSLYICYSLTFSKPSYVIGLSVYSYMLFSTYIVERVYHESVLLLPVYIQMRCCSSDSVRISPINQSCKTVMR